MTADGRIKEEIRLLPEMTKDKQACTHSVCKQVFDPRSAVLRRPILAGNNTEQSAVLQPKGRAKLALCKLADTDLG